MKIWEIMSKLVFIIATILFSLNLYSQTGWQRLITNPSYIQISTHFSDANIGIIVGYDGLILKTTDGGSNWTNLFAGDYNWSDVVMLTKDNIIIVGESAAIKRSTDGGTNFITVQGSQGIYHPPKLCKLDSVTVVTAYGNSFNTTYYKSTNSGVNWSSTVVQNLAQNYIFFLSKNTGWISGSYEDGPPYFYNYLRVFRTSNSGTTWALIHSSISNAVTSGTFCFRTPSDGYWQHETSGTLKITNNGGVNWSNYSIGSNQYITSMFFKS